MKKLILKGVGILFFFFFSCSTEELNISVDDTNSSKYTSENEKTYTWLLEQGFEEQDIQIFENHYIVENDIFISKDVTDNETELKSSKSSEQRINSQTPRDSNVDLQIMDNTEVSFYIYPDMPQMFIDASLLAIERWNEVLNNIELTVTTNIENADTEILLDSQEVDPAHSDVYPLGSAKGLARIGSRWGPGEKIWINESFSLDGTSFCFGEQVTAQERLTTTIMHEIGHVLAFLHTNSWDGLHVEGSAPHKSISDSSLGEKDIRSIMNSSTCGQGFSIGDIRSIENIYGMPEQGVTFKNYTLDYAVSNNMITYPLYSNTLYSGSGSKDKGSGSYFNTKYFDGSITVCWDIDVVEHTDYLRVKLLNKDKTEVLYDKWAYIYSTIDDPEYESEFGITIPKEHYLDYNGTGTGAGYIQVFYGDTIYKDEVYFYAFSVDE